MKIYGISGLGADERVFKYLSLDFDLIPIEWIPHNNNESIEDYSARLSKAINQSEDFGILGVSFGGLVAVEISKILNPKITILISSAETRNEIGSFKRLIGNLKILKLIPSSLLKPPKILAHYFFGAKNKSLLNQILNDTDLKFTKWAINELLNWKNNTKIDSILKISGTKDKLLPPSENSDDILINGGQHFMIVDRAEEISKLINLKIKDTTTKAKAN